MPRYEGGQAFTKASKTEVSSSSWSSVASRWGATHARDLKSKSQARMCVKAILETGSCRRFILGCRVVAQGFWWRQEAHNIGRYFCARVTHSSPVNSNHARNQRASGETRMQNSSWRESSRRRENLAASYVGRPKRPKCSLCARTLLSHARQ